MTVKINNEDVLVDMDIAHVLRDACGSAGSEIAAIRLGRDEFGWADAALILRGDSVAETGRLMKTLEESTIVARAEQRGVRLAVRLSDEIISQARSVWETNGYISKKKPEIGFDRALVTFGDPNANKEFHIGHLRQLILGEAIASMLEFAGCEVTRQSKVCDVGQVMAETVTGYRLHFPGRTPADTGLDPDVFAGECYRWFVHNAAPRRGETEEEIGSDDRAMLETVEALENRDPDMLEAWRRIRSWAVQGQDATLRRLGIAFDRLDYESESIPNLERIVALGLDRGVLFERDQTVFMEPLSEDADPLPMMRPGGKPTGYMRTLALWFDLQSKARRPTMCVRLMGLEWLPIVKAREPALKKMVDCPLYENQRYIGIGDVNMSGRRMSSSDGNVTSINACLDRVAAEVASSYPEISPADVESRALAIVQLHFLDIEPSRPCTFDPNSLIDPGGVGWRVLNALDRTDLVRDEPGTEQADVDCRRIILMNEELPAIWQRAVDRTEPRVVVRHLAYLCDLVESSTLDPSGALSAKAGIVGALDCLGVLPTVHFPPGAWSLS